MTNHDTLTAQSVGQVLQTLETKAFAGESPTTPPPPSADKPNSENSKRVWLDRWLAMEANHPQLEALENSIYGFCRDYARCPRRGRRMILYGENGCGKSHTANRVNHWANRIAMHIPLVDADQGIRLADSVIVNWPTVVDGFKTGQWDLEDLFECSLLIIDDIGAEHDPSRVGIEKLYLLLERRAQKWTLLTTNIHPANWETRFERRIADRLFRNCDHVDLTQVPSYSTV